MRTFSFHGDQRGEKPEINRSNQAGVLPTDALNKATGLTNLVLLDFDYLN